MNASNPSSPSSPGSPSSPSNTGSPAPVPTIEQAIAVIGAAGYQSWSNAITRTTPSGRAYYERIMNPLPGDLVVETSSFSTREWDDRAHTAVGFLGERVTETLAHDDHEPGEEPEYYTEQVWYVTPNLGGDTVRWTDAHFVAIPTSTQQGHDWATPHHRHF